MSTLRHSQIISGLQITNGSLIKSVCNVSKHKDVSIARIFSYKKHSFVESVSTSIKLCALLNMSNASTATYHCTFLVTKHRYAEIDKENKTEIIFYRSISSSSTRRAMLNIDLPLKTRFFRSENLKALLRSYFKYKNIILTVTYLDRFSF